MSFGLFFMQNEEKFCMNAKKVVPLHTFSVQTIPWTNQLS